MSHSEEFKVGTYVVLPSRNEWGIGKVVSIDSKNIRVVFSDCLSQDTEAATRSFRIANNALRQVAAPGDSHLEQIGWDDQRRTLTGATKTRRAHSAVTRSKAHWSLDQARTAFLGHFPGGFQSPKYVEWERSYKWNAHERFQDLLGDRKGSVPSQLESE